MNYFKNRAISLKLFVLFLFMQNLVLAQDDFREFTMKIYKKDLKGVEELINKGVDVNICPKKGGSTPLMVACSMRGTDEIIELLLSKGADVNFKTERDGRTPLMWAAKNSEKAVELLLAKGADVKTKGLDGMTAFIQSIYGILSGSVTTDVCDLLLEKGADVNAQLTGDDAAGWTALLFASKNEKLDLVKYLISKGADINHKAKDGKTALSLSLKNENSDITKLLKSKGANE